MRYYISKKYYPRQYFSRKVKKLPQSSVINTQIRKLYNGAFERDYNFSQKCIM